MGYFPTMKFASGFEIMEYCQRLAEKFGFYDHCLFHTTVEKTVWDESAEKWTVMTDRGDKMKARFVILANGLLTTPKLARIEGMETFKGEAFHTSRWNYHLDLKNKMVGIIGTGATAVQVVPVLAKIVKKLYVFQRTPSSIDVRDQREIGGTTRDSVDAVLKYHGQEIVLVDTAGLRKRAKIKENVEFYSYLRTQRAIESCTTAVLLLDARDGLEAQDIKVLTQAESLKKGLVVAINKWDLIEKETNTALEYENLIRERLQTLDYIPIITISAVTKQRLYKLIDKALEVEAERHKRIPTSELNEWIGPVIARHNPPLYRNQRVKIKYVTQVRSAPPVFQFFTNHPKGIREAYRRYIENQLRREYGFEGVPLKLVFKKK